MLEDFIETNQLQSYLSESADGVKIKCMVAESEKTSVLLIILQSEAVPLERLREIAQDEKLEWATGKEAEQITGYAENFVPPVSVYGPQIFIDSKIMAHELVSCRVSEEMFLNISPREIVEANNENDVSEADI